MPDHRAPIAPKRVVHYAEGDFSLRSAKMTVGVIRYGVHESVAVIDSSQAGQTSQQVIGHGGDIPVVASIKDSLQHRPEAMLVGITPVGGRVSEELRRAILEAIDEGLDVYAGLHDFLTHDEEIMYKAKQKGVQVHDLRKPAPNLPVGKGRCRTAKSYIALTVGSDAASGKMTVALEVCREAQRRGVNAEFVATGQVGIAIAGWGSPVDAIPGDFMAGAVESDVLSADGADMIMVEGQGALLHPGFSSVTLALLHGACPHGLILNHQVTRKEVSRMEQSIPIPSLDKVAQPYIELMEPIRPTKLVGVSLNTSGVSAEEADKAVEETEKLLGVPATDPVRHGPEKLVDALEEHRRSLGL